MRLVLASSRNNDVFATGNVEIRLDEFLIFYSNARANKTKHLHAVYSQNATKSRQSTRR